MSEDTDKAIREADEKERAQFRFCRCSLKGAWMLIEALSFGAILFYLWQH